MSVADGLGFVLEKEGAGSGVEAVVFREPEVFLVDGVCLHNFIDAQCQFPQMERFFQVVVTAKCIGSGDLFNIYQCTDVDGGCLDFGFMKSFQQCQTVETGNVDIEYQQVETLLLYLFQRLQPVAVTLYQMSRFTEIVGNGIVEQAVIFKEQYFHACLLWGSSSEMKCMFLSNPLRCGSTLRRKSA